MQDFNLLVMGAGAAGQMAAKKAALLGRKVAVVDTMKNTLAPQRRIRRVLFRLYGLMEAGMLDPKALCEALINGDEAFLQSERPSVSERVRSFFFDDRHDPEAETEVTRAQLRMRNLTLLEGRAKFLNIDEVEIATNDGKNLIIEPSNIIIATGSKFMRPDHIPFDEERVHDAGSIFGIKDIPASIIIVGPHLVPLQFAIVFALMGSRVTLVVPEGKLFDDLDEEIGNHLSETVEGMGIEIVYNATVEEVQKEELVRCRLGNDEVLGAEMLLWLGQRAGNTASLECAEAGVELDYVGNIRVDADLRTSVPHIYAVGDVVHSPMHESIRKYEGRKAASIALGLKDTEQLSDCYPVGIYALPEIAYYGMTEEAARAAHLPCVIGKMHYGDLPHARLSGMQEGFIKLVVHRDTEAILGVHIFGRMAQEVIHFGMQLVEDKVTVRRLVGTVFNAATRHELYHYAAMDAHQRLR